MSTRSQHLFDALVVRHEGSASDLELLHTALPGWSNDELVSLILTCLDGIRTQFPNTIGPMCDTHTSELITVLTLGVVLGSTERERSIAGGQP